MNESLESGRDVETKLFTTRYKCPKCDFAVFSYEITPPHCEKPCPNCGKSEMGDFKPLKKY